MKGEIITQAGKYLVVGGFCTIVDIGLLYLLTSLGVHYLFAAAISFITGVTLNYFMCTGWIFRKSKIKNKGVEITLYFVISTIGLLISLLGIWLLTELLSLHYMLSKLLATMATLVWNFLSRKYFLHN